MELLTPTQERALLEVCDDWQLPLFLTLMLTGVRPGELCHLLLAEDLDLTTGLLRVRNKPRLGWQVKTRNERDIPLQTFLQPFFDALQTPQQQTNAHHYVQGLLSRLGSKDIESIAYLHDRERQGLQKFIGQADWDHQPLLTELARQVGTERGL